MSLAERPRVIPTLALAIALLIALGGVAVASAVPEPVAPAASPAPDPCAVLEWRAAWAAPPQDTSADQSPEPVPAGDEGARPSGTFEAQTLRMILTPNLGGDRLRIHLSNRFGTAPVTFWPVRVGLRREGASIVEGSDRVVTFGGEPAVTIAPGATTVSDPVDLAFAPFTDVAVSIHVAGQAPLDIHLFAQQTQFASDTQSGDHTADVSGDAFTEQLGSWLAVSALDVMAPRRTGVVVALGDSVTDGVGSTVDANRRWPDLLARRIATEGGPALTVVSAAIAGNQLDRDNVISRVAKPMGMGPSALDRFDIDVLQRVGVTDVVLFAGINDIYSPTSDDPVATITASYVALVERARAAGLRVIGTTVTAGGLPPPQEAQRAALNAWIRTSSVFDAVFDLDGLVSDPSAPGKLDTRYAADPVHLNDAGYAVVAGAIDPSLFQGTACGAS